MLTGEPSLLRAAREVMSWGPSLVVAKRGEYGAALFSAGDGFFALPAFPLETVADPTGAGDSFAGGFLGSLAAERRRPADARRAAPGDGLRDGAGLVQRRGVRHRARAPPDRRGDRRARGARWPA